MIESVPGVESPDEPERVDGPGKMVRLDPDKLSDFAKAKAMQRSQDYAMGAKYVEHLDRQRAAAEAEQSNQPETPDSPDMITEVPGSDS